VVVITVIIVAFIVAVARGHSGRPYTWLGGLAYIAAVVALRVRR
jgi:hypothetical protein